MKVKELIEELQKFDPEAGVVAGDYMTGVENLEVDVHGDVWLY